MTATTPSPAPPGADIPFSVQGFVTDPKSVGYQIVTNYESTYWRALIGNDAWSLYEVLRSFCHDNKTLCYPSINLLMIILGIKDRRTITGHTVVSNQKDYYYPGLIEVLQKHKLVIAQIEDEGPKMRYKFHVNLTPGLLAEEALEQLHPLLQKKHQALIKECEKNLAKLEAKRKPPKPPQKSSQSKPIKGLENFQTPLENFQTPSGKFPREQYQYNNTQLSARARADHNNNSSGTSTKSDVVVAFSASKIAKEEALSTSLSESVREEAQATSLIQGVFPTEQTYGRAATMPLSIDPTVRLAVARSTETSTHTENNLDPTAFAETDTKLDVAGTLLALGLADTVTKRLTSRYHAERIAEKIEFLAHLQEHAPEKVKNPRGWLRRAIEENYGPPDGFLTQAERTQLAAAAEAEAQAAQAYVLATQARQAEQAAQQVAFRQQLDAQYGTTEEDLAFWEIAQTEIKFASISHPDLKTLLANAEILKCDGATVQIGIPQGTTFRQLGHPGTKKVVQRVLTQAAGRRVEPEFVLLASVTTEESKRASGE